MAFYDDASMSSSMEGEMFPDMIEVKGGTFTMGSPNTEKKRHDDNHKERRHEVTIEEPFAVGIYPVTVEQFIAFVENINHKIDNDYREIPFTQQIRDHPVVCVSWYEAKKYVEWLSENTEKEYRLLSEAEWEYAARAGTTTAYYFGDTISKNQANYHGRFITTVGSYPANAFGLYDMHGNVWEWVEDRWHDNYVSDNEIIAPGDGSSWNEECEKYCEKDTRVLRGGSWVNGPARLRSAERTWYVASGTSKYLGFRVARTVEKPVPANPEWNWYPVDRNSS